MNVELTLLIRRIMIIPGLYMQVTQPYTNLCYNDRFTFKPGLAGSPSFFTRDAMLARYMLCPYLNSGVPMISLEPFKLESSKFAHMQNASNPSYG